jgi:hypothetical protein
LLGADEDEEEAESTTSSSATASHQDDPKVKARLKDLSVDYARGEGRLDSESSSSEEEEEDDLDEDHKEADGIPGQFDRWGELDRDAETTEEATARLAVCNMDWDRVGADDLFLALSSFCPAGGAVKSVKVFTSDFGEQRLKDEERLGPEELRARDQAEADAKYICKPFMNALFSIFYVDISFLYRRYDSDDDIDQEEADRRAMERVRAYQVNRLRYYYAVAELDSPASANAVYTECDGKEYELSATRFDLRFIPDDMSFDDRQPVSVCLRAPDPKKWVFVPA